MSDQLSGSSWRRYLETLSHLLMICAAVATLVVMAKRLTAQPIKNDGPDSTSATPRKPISLKNAATRGSVTAPIVLVEFVDFQCPYCRLFVEGTLPDFGREFIDTGRVLFAFRNFPLERSHPLAVQAAKAADCAAEQGRFWAMHDVLMAKPEHLDEKTLQIRAEEIGLGAEVFGTCMTKGSLERVRADLEEGRGFGVTGTPTFLIGRRQADGQVLAMKKIFGNPSLSSLRMAIGETLNQH